MFCSLMLESMFFLWYILKLKKEPMEFPVLKTNVLNFQRKQTQQTTTTTIKMYWRKRKKRRLWQPAEGNWPDYIFISVLVVGVCVFVILILYIFDVFFFFWYAKRQQESVTNLVCRVGVGWSCCYCWCQQKND